MHLLVSLSVVAVLLASPASGQARTDAKKVELDGLLTALAQAPDTASAGRIEGRVRGIWLQSGSAAATLLMGRGVRDLNNEAFEEAEADFDAALVLEPELADGFAHRAVARFGRGDYAGAVADIGETLKREPRHFVAFESLSRIAEARGDFTGALAAWKQALVISPKTEGGEERAKLLEKKAFGEAT